MIRKLDVYLHERKVGSLGLNKNGKLYFRYSEEWLSNGDAVPLSCSLPLVDKTFNQKSAQGFFAGILPEGDHRKSIASHLKVSFTNDFSILVKMGGECAGAVTLLPEDFPFEHHKDAYQEISGTKLAAILNKLPSSPLFSYDEKIRLSLAGAQFKIALKIENGRYFLPIHHSPTTHIIKPESLYFEGLVENEYFCMNLAREIGLDVPAVGILREDRQNILTIERYDRINREDGSISRIHQEDFCQALGVHPMQKYQSEGGPGFKHCFSLIREHSTIPVQDITRLLDVIIFNYMIGNNDAHAKNFSILRNGNDIRLAPFYDLLCTAIYPSVSDSMAMKLGGSYSEKGMNKTRVTKFAEETGMNPHLVRKRFLTVSNLLESKIDKIMPSGSVENEICAVIKERSRGISRRLG